MNNKTNIWTKFSHLFIPCRSNNHRPKILHPESLIVLALVATGFFSLIQTARFFPSLHNSILGFSSSITVEDVVSQTNQKRVESGLQPLTLNAQLSAAALAKAQDMLDKQYWAHSSPDGKQPWDFMKAANYRYRVAGENLARDFYHTSDMIQAWMTSPTHRDNILNSQYQQIGIAVVNGNLEGFETTLVVQMFGTPATSQPVVGEQAAVDQATTLASDTTSNQDTPPAQTPQAQLTSDNWQAEIHNPVRAVADDQSFEDQDLDWIKTDSLSSSTQSQKKGGVLSSFIEPLTQIGSSPLFSPLQLTKIIFLAVILLVIFTLIYDSVVIGNRKTMRLVGENLAHIILFSCVAFLLILFKGGMIK
ncbi:MAG: Uncharacterized protein XD95_0042 [Microgenomates bacterium 39_7]|nr:MAG: Uncharacterized protein XD95_0042 [Microgenomates bacterium 39_7]